MPYRAVVDMSLMNHEYVAGADTQENNVHQILGDDLTNLVAKLLYAAVTDAFAGAVAFGAKRGNAGGHVSILGVGQDEIATRGIGDDTSEFRVEGFFA